MIYCSRSCSSFACRWPGGMPHHPFFPGSPGSPATSASITCDASSRFPLRIWGGGRKRANAHLCTCSAIPARFQRTWQSATRDTCTWRRPLQRSLPARYRPVVSLRSFAGLSSVRLPGCSISRNRLPKPVTTARSDCYTRYCRRRWKRPSPHRVERRGPPRHPGGDRRHLWPVSQAQPVSFCTSVDPTAYALCTSLTSCRSPGFCPYIRTPKR